MDKTSWIVRSQQPQAFKRRERYDPMHRYDTLPDLARLLAEASFILDAALHRLAGRPYGTGEHGLFIYARKERP